MNFSATMATKRYTHKVPVEIWREILRLTIGPSLSDPDQDTLRAYDELFMYHGSLAELYVKKERTRHTLMLVCKLWREILEGMDDKIVIGGTDEFDWPPSKRRDEANYIQYIDLGWNSYREDPISTSRMRRGRDAGVIPESSTWDDYETLELVIGAEKPPAPIMLVNKMRIKLEREVPTTFNGRVRVFQWSMPDENTDVEILTSSLFDNLTYLALSLPISLPGEVHDFPQALVQPQWTFPTLRALVVRYNSDDPDRVDAFGRWRCPNLTMLRYTAQTRYSVLPGMLAFIRNHTQKLEELEILGDSKSYWEVEENWKRLIALKSYTFDSLQPLVEALPFMKGLWSGVDDASATRRMRILLGLGIESEPASSICCIIKSCL